MLYMVIRTEQLTRLYGQKAGIIDLTLEVEPGEIFGLLGPGKAGKTTTVQVLMDFIRPTSGRALILGMDSHRQSIDIRRRTGYLPAHFTLNPAQTGEQFLRSLARLRGSVDWELVTQLADRLKTPLDEPAGRLSASDQRKLGLVQAFMHRPELLVLDEPTTGLDTEAQQAFFSLVSAARAEGQTIFFTSESIGEMERICDRAAVIHKGRLIAVERGVQLRARALRRIEMRFAGPVSAEIFSGLPNLQDLHLMDNQVSCTVRGDPDQLIKIASQYRVMDFISQTPSLEEVFSTYYGVNSCA